MDTADSTRDTLWADDLLGRRADAEFLERLISRRTNERAEANVRNAYVVNIDAPWGSGKTFFIDHLSRQLQAAGHPVAIVNAWKDDHASDPLIAVMAALERSIEPFLKSKDPLRKAVRTLGNSAGKIALAGAKGFAFTLAKRVVGEAAEEIAQTITGSVAEDQTVGSAAKESVAAAVVELDAISDRTARKAIDEFLSQKSSLERFGNDLGKVISLIEERRGKLPMYLIIDELDRCRPPYALALLERVKHLFLTPLLACVVATDTTQLSHAVSAVYGTNFEGRRYLNRFFDASYSFGTPEHDAFIRLLLATRPLPDTLIAMPAGVTLHAFLTHVFAYYPLSLRDIERCYDTLRNIADTWTLPVPIQMGAMLPLIVSHQKLGSSEIDNQLKAQLTSLSTRETERVSNPYSMNYRIRADYHQDEGKISDLVTAYIDAAQNTLVTLIRSEHHGLEGWVEGQLANELGQLHQGGYPPNNQPYSILKRYGAIVRAAGRLAGAISAPS